VALKTPSRSVKLQLSEMVSSYPTWAHPDVHYNEADWRLLRHCYEGERAVKAEATRYLPQMESMEDDEYTTFLNNATFFNMTFRTVGALTGTVFRRNPVLDQMPKTLKDKVSTITKKGQSLRSFAQEVSRELILMGRAGILVDTVDGGDPYMVTYVAESIIDWDTEIVNGREVLTRVVLMEMVETPPTSDSTRKYKPVFRVLVLKNGVYKQEIFESNDESQYNNYPSVLKEPTRTIVPTMRGATLDYIPFLILGAQSNGWDVQRSPMMDIAHMNISHYRSYAQLEHGRYYTGFPVFWASKQGQDQTNEYTVGPNRVWELPSGEKAGIMEFNGQGLKFLENAITTKQGHIASLGGRMIGVETQAVSESDNQVAMKDRNEQALLLNLTMTLDEGFTWLLKVWARWSDASEAQAKELNIEFNKDFLLKEIASREFRAVHAMWSDGLLPVEVVYDYLKKAEVIPDWMELDEFTKLLSTSKSFVNNPDVEAKKEGYPDAKTKFELEESDKDRKSAEQQANTALTLQARTLRQQQDNTRTQPGANPTGE